MTKTSRQQKIVKKSRKTRKMGGNTKRNRENLEDNVNDMTKMKLSQNEDPDFNPNMYVDKNFKLIRPDAIEEEPENYKYYKMLIALMKDFIGDAELRKNYMENKSKENVNYIGLMSIEDRMVKGKRQYYYKEGDYEGQLITSKEIQNAPIGSIFGIELRGGGDAHFISALKTADGIKIFDPSYPSGRFASSKLKPGQMDVIGIPKDKRSDEQLYVNYGKLPCQNKKYAGDSFCQSWSIMYLTNPAMEMPTEKTKIRDVANQLVTFFADFFNTEEDFVHHPYWYDLDEDETYVTLMLEWQKSNNNIYKLDKSQLFDNTDESFDAFIYDATHFPVDMLIYMLKFNM